MTVFKPRYNFFSVSRGGGGGGGGGEVELVSR